MQQKMLIKVKYTKQLDNGTFKRVTEPYVVFSDSFTDAEAQIYEELGSKIRGEFIVKSIDRVEFNDVFVYDDSDQHYKIKTKSIKVDEDRDVQSTIAMTFLVTAESPEQAILRLRECLSTLIVDFEVTSCDKSPIIEVFAPVIRD
jgi:hypothetical protein